MNQYKAIYQIREMLQNLITEYADSDSQLTQKLKTIDQELNYFLNRGIDFKQIVDELDDSIFITDKEGNVLYVNPAYTRNTGITPDRVLNHNVPDLIEKDKLYSGGAIPDVLRTKKSAFRLSTTYGTGELIKDALDRGYRKISIAIGGSATNDGGMGVPGAETV